MRSPTGHETAAPGTHLRRGCGAGGLSTHGDGSGLAIPQQWPRALSEPVTPTAACAGLSPHGCAVRVLQHGLPTSRSSLVPRAPAAAAGAAVGSHQCPAPCWPRDTRRAKVPAVPMLGSRQRHWIYPAPCVNAQRLTVGNWTSCGAGSEFKPGTGFQRGSEGSLRSKAARITSGCFHSRLVFIHCLSASSLRA